jgi:glycosyltransferase involved in cell wall biosynthesis
MKVALIHDHLAQDGGAEKVLKVLADMFPKADIYTLLYEKENVNKYFKGRNIETSIIQKLPGGVKHYQWYLYFMPMAVEFFDLRNYDLVFSDTSSFAKGVITTPDTPHICYCHTPTRYLWSDTHQYMNELKYNKWFKKIISLVLNGLRIWDRLAADRVDHFIANSKTVEKRIQKYYRRDSTVIYPPVETEKFSVTDISQQLDKEKYFKLISLPISLGISPVNWLSFKYIPPKLISLPISLGISPVNWLLSKYNHFKLISLPISLGISPVNWLLYKYIPSKLISLPISLGISPVK